MTEEIWKAVPGYEGRYEVSSLGRVRSLTRKNPIIMKPGNNGNGYQTVNMTDDEGGLKKRYIHRLVALTFLGPEPEDKEVNHIDGDKENNAVSNLQWLPHACNLNHAYMMGLHKGCEPTLAPVAAVCPASGAMLQTFESIMDAAEAAGVARCGISNCIAGRQKTAAGFAWRHV
jgi:hypothetical protein